MKRQQLSPFRKFDNRFKLIEKYGVRVKKAKNGDLVIPLPEDILNAYNIEIRDIAIFNIIDKKCFAITFVKRTMYGEVVRI